jgi:hypothetical protein
LNKPKEEYCVICEGHLSALIKVLLGGGTGVRTQGLHLDPLHQSFLVMVCLFFSK